MRRFATLGLCALMGLAFGSRFVAAHHSTTMFDHAKTMTIRGVVLELRWVNPHVSLLVKGVVDGEQTEQEDWLMEMTSPGNLVRAGMEIDGGYTLNQADMIEVLQQIKPKIAIPMHVFTQATLDRFLARAAEFYTVRRAEDPAIVLTRVGLPAVPEVLVLPGH